MLSGAWQFAAELFGPGYHTGGARGLDLVSDTFRDANSGGAPLAPFGASYRLEMDSHYGIRLTTNPVGRDHIGHPITRHPDNMGITHFGVRDEDGLAPIAGVALSDWAITLNFYRVKGFRV